MIEPNKQLVIVVGCQRSGTTLLGQVVGGHESAVLIDEEDGFYDWVLTLFGNTALVKTPRNWSQVCRRACRKYAHPQERFAASGELLDRVSHVVLKAPNLTYCFDQIARFFPTARIVYAYRDPRAIVASMRKLPHISFVENQIRHLRCYPELLERHADAAGVLVDPEVPMHVRMAAVAGIKMSLGADFEAVGLETTRVRYEDFVTRSDDLSRWLFERVGLPPTVSGHATLFRGVALGRTDRTRAVDTASLGAWRRELSDSEQRDILRQVETVAGVPRFAAQVGPA